MNLVILFTVSSLFLVVHGQMETKPSSVSSPGLKVQRSDPHENEPNSKSGDIQHPPAFQYKEFDGPPDPGSFSKLSSDHFSPSVYKDFDGPSEPSFGQKDPVSLSKPSSYPSNSLDSPSPSAHQDFSRPLEPSYRPNDPKSSLNFSNSPDPLSLSNESNDPPFREPHDSLGTPIIHHKLTHRFQNRRNPRSAAINEKQFMDRVTILARLSNAIALQTGLLNGTIPIDAVIGELLNFGTVKVSDLMAFDSNKITEFVKKREATSIADLFRTGEAPLHGEEVIKAFPANDVFSDADKKMFFSKMKELHGKLKIDDVTKVRDRIGTIFSSLKEIQGMNTDENKPAAEKQSDLLTFRSLETEMEIVTTSYSKVTDFKNGLNELKELLNYSVLLPLETLVRLIDLRTDVKLTFDDSSWFNRLCEEVKNLRDVALKSHQESRLMNELMTARNSRESLIRAFTHGFPDGINGLNQLPAAFSGKWLLNILPGNFTLQHLFDGLKPLTQMAAKISALDNQLSNALKADFIKPFSTSNLIHDRLKEVDPEMSNYKSFREESVTCLTHGESPDQKFTQVKSFLSKVFEMKKHLDFLPTWKFLSSEELAKSEFGKFRASLEKVDSSTSWETVKALQLKVNSSGVLESFLNFASHLNDDSSNIAALTSLKKIVDEEYDREKLIEDFLKSSLVTQEKSIYECLQKHSVQSKKLATTLNVGIQLGNFKGNEVKHLEKSASEIAKFAKSIADPKAMLEEMKADVNKYTLKLNEMKDLWEDSVTIGQSVSTLRNVYSLVETEPSFTQLTFPKGYQSGLTHFIAESYEKIKPSNLKSFDEQWTGLTSGLVPVKHLINETKKLFSKIDSSKLNTIAGYGDVFREFSALPDVTKTVDFEKKLETFEYMEDKKNPNVEYDQYKLTLGELATLDLQFSKHKKQLMAMPKALEAFNDFLVAFLTFDNEDADGSEKTEHSNLVLIIVCSIFGGGLVIAGIVVLVMWRLKKGCFKPKPVDEVLFTDGRDPVSKQLIHFYMCSYRFSKPLDAYNLHSLILRTIMADEAKPNFLTYADIDKKKCRDPEIKLLNKFAIKSIEYHGNRIMTRTGLTFFALQGPLSKSKQHADTRADFLEMIVKEDLLQVVMLCRFQEPGPDGKPREVCARYFNDIKNGPLTIGDWKVTTVVEEVLEDLKDTKREADITHRRLEITHKKKKYPLHIVEHYQYNTWDDNSYPPHGHAGCFLIMEKVRNTERGAVAVHCSTGTGRTMAFIGMEYIARLVEVDTNVTFVQAATKLATYRHKAIQSIRQSYWMQTGVVFYLGQYHGLVQTYELHLHEFKELAVKTDKHPEIPKNHEGVLF